MQRLSISIGLLLLVAEELGVFEGLPISLKGGGIVWIDEFDPAFAELQRFTSLFFHTANLPDTLAKLFLGSQRAIFIN